MSHLYTIRGFFTACSSVNSGSSTVGWSPYSYDLSTTQESACFRAHKYPYSSPDSWTRILNPSAVRTSACEKSCDLSFFLRDPSNESNLSSEVLQGPTGPACQETSTGAPLAPGAQSTAPIQSDARPTAYIQPQIQPPCLQILLLLIHVPQLPARQGFFPRSNGR
jgi:hypothetical protein